MGLNMLLRQAVQKFAIEECSMRHPDAVSGLHTGAVMRIAIPVCFISRILKKEKGGIAGTMSSPTHIRR